MTLPPPSTLSALLGLAALGLVAAGLGAFGVFAGIGAGIGAGMGAGIGAGAPAGDRPAVDARTAPPAGPAVVTLLGASLSARGTWPDALAAALSACHAPGVVVRRVARVGASSAWGETRLAEALAPAGAAPTDLLVIHFAGNDAALHRGRTLGASRAAHARMIAAARAARVPVFLATMSPAWGPRAWIRPGAGAYKAMYRALAAETGAGLIDTLPRWEALPADRLRAEIPDGIHPTDAAMRAHILPAFVRALAPALGLAPCPGGSA